MATGLDVGAAVACAKAAVELMDKGRYARCVEKWERAAEAAKLLGAPDCLIVAAAEVRRSRLLALLADPP